MSPGRLVVVSPHLDDAVLSLGATIANASRRGERVDVLTVLACDPASIAAAGKWDRRGGFETEGEAATRRRAEDERACAVLGAQPVWLSYGDAPYERGGTDAEIAAAVRRAVDGADAVVVPGWPLRHADHAWLAPILVRELASTARIGLYLEQPYAWWHDGDVPAAPGLVEWARFAPSRLRPSDWLAKWRAIRSYESQLPLLGLAKRTRRLRLLWFELRAGGEAIAWIDRGDVGHSGRTSVAR
jgi:LmbE family N-acetylglucosaminyl deacetylase